MKKKNIIFQLLTSLNAKEFKLFKKQFKSKENTKGKVRDLRILKILKHYEKQDKSKDFQHLGIEDFLDIIQESSPKIVDKTKTELIIEIKKFLLHIEYSNGGIDRDVLLVDILRRRQEKEYSEVLSREIEGEEKRGRMTSLEEKLSLSNFYTRRYFSAQDIIRTDRGEEYLRRGKELLDEFYWVNRLVIALEEYNRNFVLGISKEENRAEFKTIQNSNSLLVSLYLKLYSFCSEINQHREKNSFFPLFNNFINIAHLLRNKDINFILNTFINAIQYKVVLFPSSFLGSNEIQLIYQTALQNHWLLQPNGYLHFDDFLNIITSTLRHKDLELLIKIQNNYLSLLPPSTQLYGKQLLQAYTFYLQNQYSNVLHSFPPNQKLPPKAFRINYLFQRNNICIRSLFDNLLHHNEELQDILNWLERQSRFIQRNSIFIHIQDKNSNLTKLLQHLYTLLSKHPLLSTQERQIEFHKWAKRYQSLKNDLFFQDWLDETLHFLQKKYTSL